MGGASEDGHYRRLLERSPAGLLVTTRDGEILEANQSAASALGYDSPEELLQTNIRDRHREPSRRDDLLHAIEQRGEVHNAEFAMETRDGETAHLLVSVRRDDHPEHGEDVLLTSWVDVSRRRELRKRLEHLASHDDLTGLLNRRALFDRADQALAMCQRESRMAAVVYMDILGFKQVNAQVGHRGGDEILAAVGERLRETFRESDLVARVGGDEFVVLGTLLGRDEDVDQVGRRVRHAFREPFLGAGASLRLQPAAGIAVFPEDGTDLETLLHRADRALWGPDRQKSAGIRRYSARVRGEESPGWDVAEELKRALQSGTELFNLYQPVVSADGEEVVGIETFVRWEHPRQGPLTPDEFVPEAEAAGLIREIDRRVYRAAVAQAAEWSREGLSFGWVAVNFSAQTLTDPGCIEWAEDVLDEHPSVSPAQVVIEITEHTAMQQVARTEILDQLDEEVGISISIDDFGIGYSSLLYLRRFPADYLKIDLEFVRDVVQSEGDQKVIEGIIALGNAFDMELIAEGVETDEQEAWLREAGCHHLQGFRFGRPAAADEIEDRLAR